VRGVLTEVNEGNQLRRAAIGFGAGQTAVQVVVAVDNLADGAPRPFYEVDTAAASAAAPGAVIVLKPYVAAARFVLVGRDVEQNVTQTARKIAAELATRASAAGGSTRVVAPAQAQASAYTSSTPSGKRCSRHERPPSSVPKT
jgi:hypothetical protein